MSKNVSSAQKRDASALPLPALRPDETVVPRAVWRLLEMGENASLLAPADQHRVTDALCGGGRPDIPWQRVLDLYQCDRWDLFVLVALLAAEGHAASLALLARETFSKHQELARRIGRLRERGIVSAGPLRGRDAEVRLTHAGQTLTVSLIYRLLKTFR